jgi:hypothetical protein
MRFASPEQHLDCTTLATDVQRGPDGTLAKLVSMAAELLHDRGFVVFRIGRLRLDIQCSRELCRAISEALCEELVRSGAPQGMSVEQDRPQQTFIPPGYDTRTLLPHHDGQHCSYLTPSIFDDPDWPVEAREFGTSGYTTTSGHKMYQGVFIADPGDGLSITTYYDWLGVLATVWAERHDADPASVPIPTLARWLGGNQRAALARQAEHGCSYPSLGGQLGLTEPVWNGLPFHYAEGTVSAFDRERFPLAAALSERCPCGECQGETARLFCHQMLAATGRNWRQFRRRWEVLVPSERFDLLFGHNLTTLHGGLAGGPGRLIEPFCLVVDSPVGERYEQWLAASWRRRLPRSPG